MAFFNPDGENGGKPMWTGLMNNGVTTKSLFWRFDDVPDNRPREAVSERWCFGDDVNDLGSSNSTESLGDQIACPDHQKNQWTFPLELKCASTEAVLTCEDKHLNDRENAIFNGNDITLPAECMVQNVMWDLVQKQAQQVSELTNNFQLKSAFNQAVNAYQNLMSNDCGFVGNDGYAPDCSSICRNIKEIINVKDFAPVLNQFVDFAQIFFAIGMYPFLIHIILSIMHLLFSISDSTTDPKCNDYQAELFTHIAGYQKFVGTLTNLPAQYQEN